MSIFKKKNIIAFTALLLVCTLIIPAYADVTQSDISDAVAAKEHGEQELISTEERIGELEKLKGDSETYLNELSSQLGDLQNRLTEIRSRCEERKTELEKVKEELAAQNALEQKQYEDMKLRIQYIYEESSNSGLLESLFSADSFQDFLNRAEAMSQINRYDRDMLNSYSETIRSIKRKEEEIIREQEELAELEEDLNTQIVQIQQIYEATYNDLQAYAEEISRNEDHQSNLIAEIRRQEESIDYLLAQAYAEEAARRAEEEARALAAQEAAAYAPEPDDGQDFVPEASGEEDSGEPAYTEDAQLPSEEEGESGPEVPAEEPSEATAEEPQETSESSDASEPSSEGGTYLGNFTLTAYCGCAQCCGQWASSNPTTASGAPCEQGVTVAMGGVPFGTQLLIDGHVYTVQDRGTAYGHVDIYFNDHASALAFGLRHADVYQVG